MLWHVATYVAGVATGLIATAGPIHYSDWWATTRKRQETARFFTRNVETTHRWLRALGMKIGNRSVFESFGPRGLRPDLENFKASIIALAAARERLLDLRDDNLEHRLEEAYVSARRMHDELEKKFSYYYPENQPPG